jgi:cyanophycin synthetase
MKTHFEPSTGRLSRRPPELPSLPIVAIAGTRGKSTVAWLLNEILVAQNLKIGLWTTTGVFKNGQHLVGELGPWSEVMKSLASGDLDVAIQELENSVVTGVGLPEHTYPIAAVSSLCGNNDECLISSEAAQGARAQHIVARAVRPDGVLVLNADDHAVMMAAEDTSASVTLFGLHPDNPVLRHHIDEGGNAVWLDGTRVVAGNTWNPDVISDISRAAFTLNGSLTFQLQNLLCAVALAWNMGIDRGAIADGIESFDPHVELMPGSCNILKHGDATILLDSARHVWTVRSLVRGIRDSSFRRTIVVTDCFHHLDEEHTVEAGRLIGRVADVVVTQGHESKDPSLEHFKAGLANNDVPPLVFTMPTEIDGIERAIRMLDPHDLCLILTQEVNEAVARIRAVSRQFADDARVESETAGG